MAVNGGGGVTLQFQRSPLQATTRTVHLPWNRIVVINPVVMTPNGPGSEALTPLNLPGTPYDTVKYMQPCSSHDYVTTRPLILSSYIPSLASASVEAGEPGILAEVGQAQETLPIPGTQGLHLVYRSSSGRQAYSTIEMILTSEAVPKSLRNVQVIVRVAGQVFEDKLEPDPLLRHTFAWDKTNIYNQKVYGIQDAEVSVGYEYSDCSRMIWVRRMVRLRGFDVDISGMGGWNLNIHHHYNSYQGKKIYIFLINQKS